jgi:hypothetical protein
MGSYDDIIGQIEDCELDRELTLAEDKAERLGLGIGDYVRLLAIDAEMNA